MKCENCGLELEEGVTVCPHCVPVETESSEQIPESEAARAATEETKAEIAFPEEETTPGKKKLPVWKLVISAISLILVAALLSCGVLYGMGYRWQDIFPKNNVHYKDSYTAAAGTLDKNKNKTVATVGTEKLDNQAFQYAYWTQVYSFLSQNAYFLQGLNLDPSRPFSEQTCAYDESLTWEQYFIEMALDSWVYYTTLNLLGREAGFQIDAELQTALDTLPQTLQAQALEEGAASFDELVSKEMGPGATLEGTVAFMRNFYMGSAYQENLYAQYIPDESQMEQFYAAHEAKYVEAGTSKEDGYTVDVRHILIRPEGGTLNEDGRTYTYTDEQWAAGLEKAESVYAQWLEGEATEDSFAELAKSNSVDGSASSGGLYEDVTPGMMVTEFDDWCFDETRQIGDHGIVKTVFGYHIMYYSGSHMLWERAVVADYQAEKAAEEIRQGIEKWPAKIHYKNIALGQVDLTQ